MEPFWRVELLGSLRAVRGTATIERFPNQKAAALLAYLAYHRRSHPRELLVERFWPEDELPTARHKLSMALTALRQQLETAGVPDGGVIQADRTAVRLAEGSVTTDVEELEESFRRGGAAEGADRMRHLGRVVEIYRGPLLTGFYDDWIFAEHERVLHRFLEALRQLIQYQLCSGDPVRALETALQAVTADPLSEELHAEVIRLQVALGRPAAAVRQYAELERRLREELDILPSPALQSAVRAAREAMEEPARPTPAATPGSAPPLPATSPPPVIPERPLPAGSVPTAAANGAPFPLTGAVPLGSPFYVTRAADGELSAALQHRSSIILLQGPRQIGKTSLLGRALSEARCSGARVISTDFQGFSASDMASPHSLLTALAGEMSEQLDLDADPAESLRPERSPAVGFSHFLRREALRAEAGPLVWGLDEVDRLFGCDFHSEIFGLFRSWHNRRVLDPEGPWARLTQVIAYATEAHLFITDLHQSPFNVGTRVELTDFTAEQTAELNGRYGGMLAPRELAELHGLVGGHPYLVQRGLSFAKKHEGASGWQTLRASAASAEGPYGDHLRRMLLLLGREPALCEAVRAVLHGEPPDLDSFYRLRSSGLLCGSSTAAARPRCRLYEEVLRRELL